MRFVKKAASIVAGLIILLALGGYIFVRNFDLNRYKSYIVDIVAQQTGRTLALNGDAQLGISLVPTIVINDVTLSNPEWAQNPYMVTLDKLEVKFAILPLLHKQIEVDKLILAQPKIYLETSIDGQNNWTFANMSSTGTQVKTVAQSSDAQGAATAAASATAGLGLVAKEVVLEDGLISYYDAKTKQTTDFAIDRLALDIDGGDAPINAALEAQLNGQSIEATVTASTLNSLMNDGKVDFDLIVKAYKVKVAMSGSAEDVLTEPRYALEGNIYNPAGNFGAPEVSLDTRIDGNMQAADIVIKSLNVATNSVTGKASVNWSKAKPEVTADLNAEVFDVNSLSQNSVLSEVRIPSLLISEAQAVSLVPNDKIPYDYMTLANGTLNAKIGKLILADNYTLKNVVLAAKLNNGVLNVSKLDMGIGGGQAALSLTAKAATQAVNVKMTTSNLTLQDLDSSLANGKNGNFQILSGGKLDVTADVNTNGATWRKLSENLSGQVIAIVDKSQVKTGEIKWLNGGIWGQLLKLLNIDTSKNTEMEVTCAVVRTDLKDGKASFPKGIVLNGDKLKVVGDGTVNLVNDKLSFTVAPSLNKLGDTGITQALASFAKLSGTISEPKVTLDKETAVAAIVGTATTGGAYLGSELLLSGDDSPCYTALKDTAFASRYPKSSGVTASTKEAYQNVSKNAKETVQELKTTAKELKSTAKNLLGNITSGLKKDK
jgi:hypothetical protein